MEELKKKCLALQSEITSLELRIITLQNLCEHENLIEVSTSHISYRYGCDDCGKEFNSWESRELALRRLERAFKQLGIEL